MQKTECCAFGMVRYSVSRPTGDEQTIPIHEREFLGMRRRMGGRSGLYFFDRVIRKNAKDFESLNLVGEIRRAVKENAERLTGKLKERFDAIIPYSEAVSNLVPSSERLGQMVLFDFTGPYEYFFYKHGSAIVLPIGSNSFCILAKTREEVNQLVDHIKSEFEKLSEVTRDFGLSLVDFMSGRKFQEAIVRGTGKVQNLQYKEAKNDFEKEVIEFCAQLTDSFLPNVEISFTEPTENYECDVFLGFNEASKRIVEPTDYESFKGQMPIGENLKSQLLLRTLDKAQRLGARSAVVVKGFPEDAFIELKKIADSRGIALLSETDYRDVLPKLFFQDLLRAYYESPSGSLSDRG